MSAIAAIYHRDGSRVAGGDAHPMLAALGHRGPDGSRVCRTPFAVLAHLHHWTTPEELGERQPLGAAGGRFQLAFDGRLDNRDELLRQLGGHVDWRTSDARLLLLAYERWGEECFERLIGPYAAVVFEPLQRRLVCARDPMGSRTLFYHCHPRRLLVASEERAVLAHPSVSDAPDQRRLASHVALRVPADGSTFFREVRELLPGEMLVVDQEGRSQTRFRRPRPVAGLARLADRDCADRLGELLDRSVADRLRGVGPPAVLMSGGLDSTSVAAVAARRLRRQGATPLKTISWVFDELRACDESRFIAAVNGRIGASSVSLGGDRSWPLCERGDWAANPSTPEENPYRLLKTAAYETASRLESRVLLTGGGGDPLWTGAAWWLADLLAAGRPLTAVRELARELGRRRGRALGGLRRALGLPALRRARTPTWLSAEGSRLAGLLPVGRAAAPRLAERREGVLGAREARGATIEIFHAARAGIELRHPFRDLRLVEFMLGLPAHQLYRHGQKKYLLRVAMAGLLPREVRWRHSVTGLAALYRRGVEERESDTVRSLMESADAAGGSLVRSGWGLAALQRARSSTEELALWHLLSDELWRRRHGLERAELRRTA